MGKRVLFVCYGNACRSIMAEALARHHLGDSLLVASAGIAPLGRIPRDTLEVLEEKNVSSESLFSKDLELIDIRRFDLIVNLMDLPIERFIPNGLRSKIRDRYVEDPYGRSLDSYRNARDTIERMVLEELPKWMGLSS